MDGHGHGSHAIHPILPLGLPTSLPPSHLPSFLPPLLPSQHFLSCTKMAAAAVASAFPSFALPLYLMVGIVGSHNDRRSKRPIDLTVNF